MEQIVGRIRTNEEYQNIFRDVLVHIFSTNSRTLNDDEFNDLMNEKEVQAKLLLSAQDKLSESELQALISRIDLESDIVSVINGKILYNHLKKQSFIYKQDLKKAYKNGITIRNKFVDSSKFVASKQRNWTDLEVKLAKAVTISYEQLLKDYLENPSECYELEYPEFILFKRHLTETEMNSLRWNKEKMMKAVNDKLIMDKVFINIYKKGFISSKELKEKIKNEFEKLNISLSPKATLIESCNLYEVKKINKRIDGKKVIGYEFAEMKYML